MTTVENRDKEISAIDRKRCLARPCEVIPATYLSGNERYGGYYSQKDIKEIVAYAAQRNITIIPKSTCPDTHSPLQQYWMASHAALLQTRPVPAESLITYGV